MKNKLILALLFFLPCYLNATIPQKSNENKKYKFSGYIKFLQTTNFQDKADNIITDNLFHHRVNFKYYPNESFTLGIEVRNRIHFGELVKLTNTFGQLFGDLIDTQNDVFDMSVLIVDKRSLVWHVMIDRLYLNWVKNNFEIRVGRQRINWGLALVWNPNDIFNTYSFFDFDYEERPGSDAVRLTYYTGTASSVELAVKTATKVEDLVAAVLYKWNRGRYDLQALGGVANRDMVLGGGWAGNIKNAGFKGELTYFHPYNNPLDSTGVLAGTLAFDYSFKNSLYLNTGFLYMSNGTTQADFQYIDNLQFTAKTLSPYNYSLFAQVVYPITPIFTGSLAAIYSPGKDHALFIGPGLSYSIKENWDIDVIAQLFTSNQQDKYKFITEIVFFRLKWSY